MSDKKSGVSDKKSGVSDKKSVAPRPNKQKTSIVTGTIRKILRDGTKPVSTKSKPVIKPEPTFVELQLKSQRRARYLSTIYLDISEQTVMNILTYAKQLPRIPRTGFIDDCIFKAQMLQQFNITDVDLIDQMYYVTSKCDRNTRVTVDLFAELICIFITNNISHKVDFVFKVYDLRGQGFLNKDDLKRLVFPMIHNLNADDHDDIEEGATLNYMANLLMTITDTDNNGNIDLSELNRLVQGNILMIQCLGMCLPSEEHLEKFKKKVINRNTIEVGGSFRNERRRSLRNPTECHVEDDVFKHLYPVTLEMP